MRRFLLWVLFAGLLIASRTAEAQQKRPNILFIYTDDHSHRTVSCYPEAYDWVSTPNIDKLAARGVRFSHAFIGTWCMPSRATLLTGHHQFGVESMRMVGDYPGSDYDPEKCPFWPARIHHRPNRQVAHGRRYGLRARLGFSDRLEPPQTYQEPPELLLRSTDHLSWR